MRRPARRAFVALFAPLALAIASFHAPAEEPKGSVKLVSLKFDALMARVAADKDAKLTLIDVWATWCGPCKKNFPHVLEMNEKYARKGLAVISLSLDDPTKPKQVAEALEFLQGKNATFANYLLDETGDDGFEKLGIGAIPAVFVYGPGGKELKRFTGDDVKDLFTYAQVEAFVEEHLAKASPRK